MTYPVLQVSQIGVFVLNASVYGFSSAYATPTSNEAMQSVIIPKVPFKFNLIVFICK